MAYRREGCGKNDEERKTEGKSPLRLLSPANNRSDFGGVEIGDLVVNVVGERRQRRRGTVFRDLTYGLRSGDDDRHRVEVEDPTHRELRGGNPRRHVTFHPIDEIDALGERQTGEGLADAEALAVPVEVAMIVGRELGF